jgi:hypothetical protein
MVSSKCGELLALGAEGFPHLLVASHGVDELDVALAVGGFGHQCFHGRLKLPKQGRMFRFFSNRQFP